MQNPRTCFVCVSPFQVMTAINVVLHCGIKADIYIATWFKTAKILCKRLKQKNIFMHTILVDTTRIDCFRDSKIKILPYLCTIRNYLCIDNIVSHFILGGTQYETLYIPGEFSIGRLMRLYLCKKGYDTKIIYMDEGESSYDKARLIEPMWADNILQRLLFGDGSVLRNRTLFLYSPRLYNMINPSSSNEIHSLPQLTQDDNVKQLINEIFDFRPQDSFSQDVIILDVLKENLPLCERHKRERIYTMFVNKVGANNIIIKRHPRDRNPLQHNIRIIERSDLPFEIFLMNMDIKNKILVSINSTAITTPKLIFNHETSTVYLGKLVCTRHSTSAMSNTYFECCKKLYSNQGKFFIPNTIKELEQYLIKSYI